MAELVTAPINTEALLQQVQSPLAGAAVLFIGTVRQLTAGRATASLDYEGYPQMALAKLQELEDTARKRYELTGVAVVHRLGHMNIGEASVAVAVSSAHRKVAFEAGQWLIDTLKEEVPIWKRENWADGTAEWVHPGVPGAGSCNPGGNSQAGPSRESKGAS